MGGGTGGQRLGRWGTYLLTTYLQVLNIIDFRPPPPKQVCRGAPPPPAKQPCPDPKSAPPPPAFFSSAPPRRRAPCAPRAPEWGALPADEGRACHAFFLFLFCFFAWAPPNGAQTLTTTTALSGWALGRGCLLPAGGENRGRGATTGRGTTWGGTTGRGTTGERDYNAGALLRYTLWLPHCPTHPHPCTLGGSCLLAQL